MANFSHLPESTSYNKNVTHHGTKDLVLYGFDLFFSNFEDASFLKIANYIGGNVNVDFLDGCITYKFELERNIHPQEISSVHVKVNESGEFLASKFGCYFEHSELYLRAPKKMDQCSYWKS